MTSPLGSMRPMAEMPFRVVEKASDERGCGGEGCPRRSTLTVGSAITASPIRQASAILGLRGKDHQDFGWRGGESGIQSGRGTWGEPMRPQIILSYNTIGPYSTGTRATIKTIMVNDHNHFCDHGWSNPVFKQ